MYLNFSDISEEKRERINDINQQSEPLNDRLEAIEKDHNTAKRNQAHYKEKIATFRSGCPAEFFQPTSGATQPTH